MHQIIATGITTLDEARYFAAMGVDWIGFNADQLTVDDMRSLSEWVAGPVLFAEMSAVREEQLFEIVNKTKLQGICVQSPDLIPPWYDGIVITKLSFESWEIHEPGSKVLLIQLATADIDHMMLQKLRSWSMEYHCWLEIRSGWESIPALLSVIEVHGIVVRCIKDTDTVSTSFEQYDSIFELLG